jgi:hypothetical protein
MPSRRWGRLEVFSMTLDNNDRGGSMPEGRQELLGRPIGL